jgi:hypothetical protein
VWALKPLAHVKLLWMSDLDVSAKQQMSCYAPVDDLWVRVVM